MQFPNQRGVIVPLVLLGTTAVLSGIGLFFYLRYYSRPKVAAPEKTVNSAPTNKPAATVKPVPSVSVIITDFKSCAESGNPVSQSYPRTCGNGVELYTEVLEASESGSLEASASAAPGLTDCDDYGCNSVEALR